jgi:serine/threonine protein kinase
MGGWLCAQGGTGLYELPMLHVHHRLGDFEIIRLLGKGGMGEVYEALQLNPARRVALKVLAPWLAGNDEFLRRFWREAAVPAQLDHPNIVRIISTGKSDDGLAYYTMQLVRGISLAELIKRGKDMPLPGTLTAPTVSAAAPENETPSQVAHPPLSPLPKAETTPPALEEYRQDRYRLTARLGAQAARALADAHRQGYLHRDIKPSNMMVDQHGHLYLLDFGLTRLRDGGAMATRPGTVLGTPWFMSPEQACGHEIDQRSDLYSLGITLFQLATGGHGPFTANQDNSEAVLSQVRSGTHQPLRHLAPDIPQGLEKIILRAIRTEPRRRYQDGAALAADLDAFLTQKHSPLPLWKRTKSRLAAGATLVLVLLAIGLYSAGFFRPRDQREKEQDPGVKGNVPGANPFAELPADCQPYPEFFRKLPIGFSQALMNQQHKPLWHCRLFGQGKFRRNEMQLMLPAPGTQPTLLALDIKKNRWFEFTIELNAPKGKPGQNRLGIFFGWQKLDNSFFVVEVDETPYADSQFGRAYVGVMRINKAQGVEQEAIDIRGFRLPKTSVPLSKSPEWHKVTVRALKQKLTVTVDGKTIVLDMDDLARAEPQLAGDLNLRGALGIWSWNSWISIFRNGTITVLSEDREGK